MEQQRADLAQVDELAHLIQRQIEIAEITFHEWIKHFLGFRKKAAAKSRT